MTQRLYLDDMDILDSQVRITEIFPGPKPIIRLDRTIFHPQGGGQKADRGTLGPAVVLQVANNGALVDHYVDSLKGLAVGDAVPIHVDGRHRHINSLFHTCTHHVVNTVEMMYPDLRVVTGHSWPGEARVEFIGPPVVEDISAEAINARLAADIADGLSIVRVSRGSEPRALALGPHKPVVCGGTHVRSLKEVQSCRVTTVKRKGDRIRVSFECVPV